MTPTAIGLFCCLTALYFDGTALDKFPTPKPPQPQPKPVASPLEALAAVTIPVTFLVIFCMV